MNISKIGLGLTAIAGSFFALASPAKAASFVSEITGAEMAGKLRVTVGFVNGSLESDIWKATGVNAGEATGTGWALSIAGDTSFSLWDLALTGNESIKSVKIESLGGVVFDRITLPELTPGTGSGNPFVSSSGTPPTTAIYSGTVPGALEDVASSLELSWVNGFSDPNLSFFADTDGVEDDVAVPDPSTILGLLGGSAIGAFSLKKKK